MTEAVRASNIARFCEDRGNTVFLISTLAGGTGLNLTAASKVVLVRAQPALAQVWCNLKHIEPLVVVHVQDRDHEGMTNIGTCLAGNTLRFLADSVAPAAPGRTLLEPIY